MTHVGAPEVVALIIVFLLTNGEHMAAPKLAFLSGFLQGTI